MPAWPENGGLRRPSPPHASSSQKRMLLAHPRLLEPLRRKAPTSTLCVGHLASYDPDTQLPAAAGALPEHHFQGASVIPKESRWSGI